MQKKIIKLSFFLCVCVFPFFGNTQTLNERREFRFQIGINSTFYNLFDGQIIFPTDYNSANKSSYYSTGVEWLFFINNKNGVRTSFSDFHISYTRQLFSAPPGTINERNFKVFQLQYLRSIIKHKYFNIYINPGLAYRMGNESVTVAYGWFHSFTETKTLKDFGLILGVYSNIYIYKGIRISTGISYTNFIHRNYTGGSIYYQDNGSSKSMLSINLGINYAFNTKP
jgi:hypothetical protein